MKEKRDIKIGIKSDKEFFDEVVRAYDAVVGGPRQVYEAEVSGRRLFRLAVRNLARFRESVLDELGTASSREKTIPETVWRSSQASTRLSRWSALTLSSDCACPSITCVCWARHDSVWRTF